MSMERWVLMRKGADFMSIGERFHINPRIACLIRNREIIGDEEIDKYLNGTIADLHDGMLMKDMDRAVDLLMEKIRSGASIRVIGDYDIDGVCATYILMEGIRELGGHVDMDIPDRIKDGYGLNKNLINRAYADEIDTVITCDNGIAAAEEIAYAKELGITVIVTDHHEVPFEEVDGERIYRLPQAEAVVDPKRADCEYPFKGLCGAAVAYKLVEALYEAMGEDASDIDYLLEAVGIATVGDVMDLVGENRIFVKQALEMLAHTSNAGLKSLMECTGVSPEEITSYHIGFIIGPCLNAGGRLDTAKRALALLQAKNKKEADILAGDLKALNDNRKEMTEAAVEEATRQIENYHMTEERVLVIYLPDCHESLAGIVAGRIREKYYRPTFVLTDGEDGVKGSGRSIESYHMYEGIHRCGDLLTKYGGHKLAAGLSMEFGMVEEFREAINRTCELTEEELQEKVSIDMELPFASITEEFIRELKLLEPFGKGNTKPVFAARNVEFLSARRLGRSGNVLKLKLRDTAGTILEAVCFRQTEELLQLLEDKYGKWQVERLFFGLSDGIHLAITFYPSVNEYMGIKTIQLVITHFK